MKNILNSIIATAATCAAGPILAHHGVGGQFNLSENYEVSGIITDMAWINPHAYVYFDVTDENGQVENWRCELRAAGVLARSGWSEDMFATGTRVDILGSPARREPNTCYTQTIAFNGGEPLYRYAQLGEGTAESSAPTSSGVIPARLANDRPNISGDWAADQQLPTYETVLQRNLAPPGGAGGRRGNVTVLLTEAGEQATATAGPSQAATQTDADGLLLQTGSGSLNCQRRSFFRDWTFDHHPNRITQRVESITLQYGFMDTVRTIHMNLDEHAQDLEPVPAGHSIGRWEDDVLVVETLGFSSDGFGSAAPNVVRSDQYRIVERFTLDAENQTLHRSWVAEDPLYWEDAVSGQDIIKRSETAWQPYGCDDRTNENVTN